MKKLINALFRKGVNLRDIRFYLYQIPHHFPILSELRKQEGYENLTKENHKALASEFYTERAFYDYLLLNDLDCVSFKDYEKKKKSRYSSKQHKERGGASWRQRNKQARERDNNRCVITGTTKSLFVHHINGDKTDNRLENLVTVSRQVNDAIHHGARLFHPEDQQHWEGRNPEYVVKSVTRFELLKKYTEWLQAHGYQNACLESLPLGELASDKWKTGANKHIHFSLHGKRNYHNHFWIALLEPTGLSFELQSFNDAYKKNRAYSDFSDDDFEEQKCEDCPYEGDPPCGDYHSGPYCFVVHEIDTKPSCENCLFRESESCSFTEMELGENEKPKVCSEWHEVIDYE